MDWIWLTLLIAGLVPWTFALRANRHTALFWAIVWGMAAWLSWAPSMLWSTIWKGFGIDDYEYLGLTMTACAGVAVLGARRPHQGAWNFVVLGLASVLLLPIVERYLIGSESMGEVRRIFLGLTLLVVYGNFLPTNFAWAAVSMVLFTLTVAVLTISAWPLLLFAPWIAWSFWAFSKSYPASSLDRLWLDFRNRFGFLWASRVREQFNASAKNAGWPMTLRWRGLEGTPTSEAEETLLALLKRFMAPCEIPASGGRQPPDSMRVQESGD